MRKKQQPVFIGIYGTVLALDSATGEEIWRVVLKKGQFISVVMLGEMLLASAGGELWALQKRDGMILWHNKLKGLGHGFITVAGADPLLTGVLKQQQDAAAAVAAASIAS